MYSKIQRQKIIAIAERDLSQAIQSGDPHRIAHARNMAENAYMASTAYSAQGTEKLRALLDAPIISITYEKTTGEATIARRDPATGRKYETIGNYLDQEENSLGSHSRAQGNAI